MCLLVLLLGFLPAAPKAAAGQGWAVEPRLGVVVSSALFRDPVIEGLEAVEVGPGAALEAALLGRTALSPLWFLEGEISYASGSLRASGEGEDRGLSDLRVIGGSVRVRRAWRGFEGVLGVGGLSYEAPAAAAYAEGASVFPAAILGVAVPLHAAGQLFRFEAAGRVHRHQTPVLERAGADAALVVRGSLQIGIELGSGG